MIELFFYSGYSDCVCCFSCGGSLSEWRPNDDPWVEHAYWFPECTFVIQNKGEEFVQQIQLLKKADDEQVKYFALVFFINKINKKNKNEVIKHKMNKRNENL